MADVSAAATIRLFRWFLESHLGVDVHEFDPLDNDDIRLHYSAKENVTVDIAETDIALHDPDQWNENVVVAIVGEALDGIENAEDPIAWTPGTLRAVSIVETGEGETVAETWQVEPEWADRYLAGAMDDEELGRRIDETIESPLVGGTAHGH